MSGLEFNSGNSLVLGSSFDNFQFYSWNIFISNGYQMDYVDFLDKILIEKYNCHWQLMDDNSAKRLFRTESDKLAFLMEWS